MITNVYYFSLYFNAVLWADEARVVGLTSSLIDRFRFVESSELKPLPKQPRPSHGLATTLRQASRNPTTVHAPPSDNTATTNTRPRIGRAATGDRVTTTLRQARDESTAVHARPSDYSATAQQRRTHGPFKAQPRPGERPATPQPRPNILTIQCYIVGVYKYVTFPLSATTSRSAPGQKAHHSNNFVLRCSEMSVLNLIVNLTVTYHLE